MSEWNGCIATIDNIRARRADRAARISESRQTPCCMKKASARDQPSWAASAS